MSACGWNFLGRTRPGPITISHIYCSKTPQKIGQVFNTIAPRSVFCTCWFKEVEAKPVFKCFSLCGPCGLPRSTCRKMRRIFRFNWTLFSGPINSLPRNRFAGMPFTQQFNCKQSQECSFLWGNPEAKVHMASNGISSARERMELCVGVWNTKLINALSTGGSC